MNSVEPIRAKAKIDQIKANLRSDPRNYLLFVLGLNFALRISDLLSLRIENVLHNDGAMRDFVTIREGKTGKEKRIKINDSAKEALTAFFGAQITGQGSLITFANSHSDFLFKSKRSGDHIDRIQAYRLMRRWCDDVGITDKIGTHTLRKTWGYHARKKGVDISMIMEKFNHQSPTMTKRYIGITNDEIESVEESICL